MCSSCSAAGRICPASRLNSVSPTHLPSLNPFRSLRFLLLVFAVSALVRAGPAPGATPARSILVLGDSISAGYGLPQGRGWVDLLRQRLGQQEPGWQVINASISGDTTLGGLDRLPAALRQHRPQVVIIELGANDALRGQPISAVRDNLTALVKKARAAGAQALLIGMRIPPNYGPDYTRKFQAAFTEVARAEKVPLVPFLLEGFAEKRELFQQDGIHPGEQAQPIMLDNVWKTLAPLLQRKRPAAAKANAG